MDDERQDQDADRLVRMNDNHQIDRRLSEATAGTLVVGVGSGDVAWRPSQVSRAQAVGPDPPRSVPKASTC